MPSSFRSKVQLGSENRSLVSVAAIGSSHSGIVARSLFMRFDSKSGCRCQCLSFTLPQSRASHPARRGTRFAETSPFASSPPLGSKADMLKTRTGVKLFLKDWGEGRPVVLIHGWPLSSDTFDDLAMALANAGFRAIAYDRRGFGRSEQPWGGYDYDTLADDLADVIQYAGGRDVAVLGFSMGGGEVARYLSRHGGIGVSRAMLISSVVPYMLKTSDNANGVEHSVFDQMTQSIQHDRAHFWPSFF